MGKRYAKFITESGGTVQMDEDIEVAEHLTGQVIPARRTTPHAAVVISAKLLGTPHNVLALRCKHEYARRFKHSDRGRSGPVRRLRAEH